MLIFEKPREIAFRVLQQRERSGGFIEELIDTELGHSLLTPPDRRLLLELSYGAVRWQRTLDLLIEHKTGGRRQSAAIQILLRLGLYQLLWLDRIPDHAVVFETVEIAKRNGLARNSGFINAVLRGYIREREATARFLTDLRTTNPPAGYSHSDWIFERWKQRMGLEKTCRLMEWNNKPARVFARINELRTDQSAILLHWHEEGVESTPFGAPWLKSATVFEIRSQSRIGDLPSFRAGLFYIQDPSTLMAVELLAPLPHENVFDCCAAPGGKTLFMAQLMKNQGHIVSRDIHPKRMNLLRENCTRLGATCVIPILRGVESCSTELYDRILVDAPCSNSGVMRRRVDLRWRITDDELKRLIKEQMTLLTDAASKLKANGTLVYSTCSLEPEENREIIEQFLEKSRGFVCDVQKTLDPTTDGVDGCYAARIRRTAASM
ncbi:MAG: 16S rRNA (cytosine(967)-C(5))-methyltransferase RsmB [Verrucomicrobia bacterium]|nr:16S rRNA (cytosine(967)-C(5))-methyltransferase RsmB [Verrucomicrobiota bacterium]